MKFDLFKQYHLERCVIFSDGDIHHAESYQWLLRIQTGIRNWTIDVWKDRKK